MEGSLGYGGRGCELVDRSGLCRSACGKSSCWMTLSKARLALFCSLLEVIVLVDCNAYSIPVHAGVSPK